jgi:hypothetical protein
LNIVSWPFDAYAKINTDVKFLNKSRQDEVLDSVADNKKLKKILGIQKFIAIEERLKR